MDARVPAEFHHIGLACRKIEAELAEWAALGYEPEGPATVDPIQKVTVQFLVGGGPRIELIEPASPDSPVNGVIKRGSKLYHLAYATSRFDEALQALKDLNYLAISEVSPAPAFAMKRIVFLMSRTSNLIELVEVEDRGEP